MKKSTKGKMLITLNEKNIFYKIKRFFYELFNKETKKSLENYSVNENTEARNKFIESLKNIDNEEGQLLELQKKYRSGKIKEEELTEKQICALCELYDRQIANLKKSNSIKKKKILENMDSFK